MTRLGRRESWATAQLRLGRRRQLPVSLDAQIASGGGPRFRRQSLRPCSRAWNGPTPAGCPTTAPGPPQEMLPDCQDEFFAAGHSRCWARAGPLRSSAWVLTPPLEISRSPTIHPRLARRLSPTNHESSSTNFRRAGRPSAPTFVACPRRCSFGSGAANIGEPRQTCPQTWWPSLCGNQHGGSTSCRAWH